MPVRDYTPRESPGPEKLTVEESAHILTLSEYKTLREITSATAAREAQIELALSSADQTILTYTGRDFLTVPTLKEKEFQYDGGHILTVGDMATINFVKTAQPLQRELIAGIDYMTGPVNGPVIEWLDFGEHPARIWRPDPEMGFMRNYDQIAIFGTPYRFSIITVEGQFGWPGKVPASVKMAAAYLIDEMAKPMVDVSEGLQSKSIASFSEVYMKDTLAGAQKIELLPEHVRQLLDPWRRESL